MSTSLDPTIPLQKTAEITKHLRSRDVPLKALLPLALRILDNTGGKENEKNIYFPQKEDWLLEWLVQRLRQDDSCAPEARCDPEFWVFLLRLLPMSPSAGGILKKHNILQLISKALSEAALLQKRDLTALRVQGKDEDIDMDHEEIYSTPKERLSSDSSASSPEQILLLLRAPPRLQDLLASVSGVLSYIQGNLSAGKGDGNIVVVLRGTPEAGAQILGSFLEASHVLIQEGIEIEEEWINTVVNVWRSCVWGNPQLKKLSMIFSTSCLVPATHLLMTPSIPSNFRRKLEQLLAEFIFPHEILFPAGLGTTGLSSKELKPLLGPLKAQKDGLSNIFRIAITSQTKRRKPDSTFVEVIFESITSAVLGISFPIKSINTRDTEIVMSLLEVLIETGTSISSNTIAELVDGISNLSHGNTSSSSVIRWDIIAVALKLDFDVFLGKGNEERALKLFNSLTNGFADQETVYEVVKLLIDGFVKARDLSGFASIWISELRKEGARDGIWESDRVAKLFSERMESSLLPGQMENVLKTAIQENSWVVIEGLLRGMKREDTHNKVKPLLNKITDKILESEVGWRGWRALVRVLQIKSGLADGKQGKILNILKKYVERGTNDDARSALFIGEVLMNSADDEGQDEVICMFIKAMKSTTRSWDRSIGDINPENLGVAIVLGVIGRWMTALERAQSDIRTKFVDEFLSMAIENDTALRASDLTGRMLWQSMLVRGVSYEHPSLKDAILAALVTKLGSRFEISQDMNASLRDIEKGRDVPMTEKDVECYKFLIQSISKFPLEAIKRTIRERILDVLVLLDSSLKKEGSSVLLRDVVKRLVARLWALGNASSFLARDVNGFMAWSLEEDDVGETGRRILRCIFATKEQERSREFLAKLVKSAEITFLRNSEKPTIREVKACEIIIEEFWRAGERNDVQQLRGKVLNQLRNFTETGEINGHMIGAWRRIWALDQTPSDKEEVLGFAQNIIERIKGTLPKILTVSEHLGEDGVEGATHIVAETVMILCASANSTEKAVKTTALVVAILDSPFAQCYRSEIILAYREMISVSLDPEVYLDCMEIVIEGCYSLEETAVPAYWEILKVLINGAKIPEEEDKSKIIIECLSKVFSKLARNLPKTKTVTEFLAVTDCMDIILREKTWAVMQYNIDETLASVAITSSPSGPQFTPVIAIADEIFLRLCNILRLTLSQHRRRVRGGRYHLVVAALQSLLHCIFKRKTARERKKTDKILHPPWLLPSTITSEMPIITDKCADGFNRLLATFCEPSAYSVRGKTRGGVDDNLVNSVRDREKREVASCVGGLLGEILKGNLAGGLDGDIKSSINAIFEVLGTEGVKAFARTVDKEGRAMLRELRDEYNRVGGGASEKF